MNDENQESKGIDDQNQEVLIHTEKEKDFRFSLLFKWILALAIIFSGILSIVAVWFLIACINEKVWIEGGVNNFLYNILFFICIALCFVSLVGIAIRRKPFTKILVGCTMAVGLLFVVSSILFPRIPGYRLGVKLVQIGNFVFADAIIFLFGILGILFSLIMNYGFMYQRESDTTV